jgi:hypothetical protein
LRLAKRRRKTLIEVVMYDTCSKKEVWRSEPLLQRPVQFIKTLIRAEPWIEKQVQENGTARLDVLVTPAEVRAKLKVEQIL